MISLLFADLSQIELAGERNEAPSEFLILRKGENATRKGIVVFDDQAAESVMAEYEKGGVDLPLDWDHAMASSSTRVEDRKAAGWFKPEVRNGDLWAVDVTWTDEGRKAVESRSWRYTSLWGDIDPLDKSASKVRLRRLRNVALVNTPATLHTLPLVASEHEEAPAQQVVPMQLVLSLLGSTEESEAVAKVKDLQAVLAEATAVTGATGSDQIVGSLRALKLQADKAVELQTKIEAIEAKLAEDKKDALIATLSEAGKLPPSMHDWAKSVSLAVLQSFGEAAPVQAQAEPVKPAITNSDAVVVTDDDSHVAKLLGLSDKDVAKGRKTDLTADDAA